MDLYAVLAELVEERKRIDRLIRVIEGFADGGEPSPDRVRKSVRGRKSMGRTEREEVSRRMKRYWASRRNRSEDGRSVG